MTPTAVVQIMFLPPSSTAKGTGRTALATGVVLLRLFYVPPRICYDSRFTSKSRESANQSSFVREMQVYALHDVVGSSPGLVC